MLCDDKTNIILNNDTLKMFSETIGYNTIVPNKISNNIL